MLRWLETLERGVVWVLVGMMALVTALATVELGIILFREIISPPVGVLDLGEILELFGTFLVVLIALELLHSMKLYITERRLDVEMVMMVALIAIARKVIVFDFQKTDPPLMYAIAAVILSLSAGLWLLRHSARRRSTVS